MISIVVCSKNEEMFAQFSRSAAATIAVPFEIIRIDNRQNEYSICEAYNKGKELCNYDTICFSHEDILFETANWGPVLLDILTAPEIGLVGVLGICYLGLFPNAWVALSEAEGQVIVGAKKGKPTETYSRFPGHRIAEVVAIDGIFMAARKSVISQFRFSDDLLKGFHGYDIDISWQIRRNYKLVVSRELLFYHHSGGAYNASYYVAMKLLSKKWKRELPAFLPAYTKKEIQDLKIRSLDKYCQISGNRKLLVINNLHALHYAARHGVLYPWVRKKIKNTLKRFSVLSIGR